MPDNVEPTVLELRIAEVEQYKANIAMDNSIYDTLPKEWPAHLEKFRKVKNRHEAIDEVESLGDVELLSKLWYADDCHKAIRSETVEMTKAQSILNALQS